MDQTVSLRKPVRIDRRQSAAITRACEVTLASTMKTGINLEAFKEK